MTKTNDLASAFIKISQGKSAPIARPPINAFSSLFSIQELTDQEKASLASLLDDVDIDASHHEDLDLLVKITQEVKAIKKQEMLLIGERIASAREIFKKYKEKGFRQWLDMTFGSFKTGYNYLAFYDLYVELPESLKDLLKGMPAKAAYVLASKKVPIELKAEIVKEHAKESASSIIESIHHAFGVNLSRRKSSFTSVDSVLNDLEKQMGRLFLVSQSIGAKQKKKITHLIKKLQTFV
jgi:hypothetical protein